MAHAERRLVLGRVLQVYPPFLVRELIAEGDERFPRFPLPLRAITMLFHGEEMRITTTEDSRIELPRVIYALRLWVADRSNLIRAWEEHDIFMQRSEQIAHLAADLEAEQATKGRAAETYPGESNATSTPGKSRVMMTVEQVLANQRDELERMRQLSYEVEHGLQALEASHPEAVVALDEIADEIARRSTGWNEG